VKHKYSYTVQQYAGFSGAIAKLLHRSTTKLDVTVRMSALPSTGNMSTPHGRLFVKFHIRDFLPKIFLTFTFRLNTKKKKTVWRNTYVHI